MSITAEDLAQAQAHLRRGRQGSARSLAKPALKMQILSESLQKRQRSMHPHLPERIRALAKEAHGVIATGAIEKLVDDICHMIVQMAGVAKDTAVARSA